jgi:hypothetical protein
VAGGSVGVEHVALFHRRQAATGYEARSNAKTRYQDCCVSLDEELALLPLAPPRKHKIIPHQASSFIFIEPASRLNFSLSVELL